MPMFYNRGGEVRRLPQQFEESIKKVTLIVCCVGCKHTHVGVPSSLAVRGVVDSESGETMSQHIFETTSAKASV